MELSKWVDSERGRQSLLGRSLSVPSQLVWQWARQVRPVPIERCVEIERSTNGEVRRWDLRPHDWHLVWPELIGADGAPALASREAA